MKLGTNERDRAQHPEDYNEWGFPILMNLAEAAQLLGLDEAETDALTRRHRIERSDIPGRMFKRPDIRALREVLIASGTLPGGKAEAR